MNESSVQSGHLAAPSARQFFNAVILPKGIAVFGLTLIGALLGIVVTLQWESLVSAMPLVAAALVAGVLHAKVRLWSLSPVALLVFGYSILGVTGALLGDRLTTAFGTTNPLSLSPLEERGAYLAFMIAAISAAGGALAYAIARSDGWPRFNGSAAAWVVSASPRVRTFAALLSLVPLGLVVVSRGSELLVRSAYITYLPGDPTLVAGAALAFPSVAILGWLSQMATTIVGKAASWVGLILYTLVLFALATRAFALIPIMVALGMIAARPSANRFRAMLPVAVLASVLLLNVPLALRGSPSHGLIPYLSELGQGLVTFDLGPLGNVLFSFQLTGRVGFGVPALPISDLFISFDPRPGSTAGWYDIASDVRINTATPYNALGELANYGWPAVVTFFFCSGAYLGHIDRTVRRLLGLRQGFAALALFGLSCLFVVMTLQYNLRSNVRLLYYMVALDVAIMFLGWLRTKSEQELATKAFGNKL